MGVGLAALQQFTGINVVFYYGATLWQAAGFTEENALLQNVISGSVNVIFTFVAIALVDKVGRKPLLLVGALGQAVMLGTLALLFGTAGVNASGDLMLEGNNGLYALLAANAYIAFFAFSWGPVMWVMLGEMFPNQFRGAALAFCGLVQWSSNFAITMTFPIMLTSIGLGFSYGIYATFGLIAYVFVRRFVKETKGRRSRSFPGTRNNKHRSSVRKSPASASLPGFFTVSARRGKCRRRFRTAQSAFELANFQAPPVGFLPSARRDESTLNDRQSGEIESRPEKSRRWHEKSFC